MEFTAIPRVVYVLLTIAVLTVAGVTIYHVQSVAEQREQMQELRNELNATRSELSTCRGNLSDLERDLQKFEQLYTDQSTQLSYSRTAQLLALFYQAKGARDCLPTETLNVNGLSRLEVQAAVNGTVPVHVLTNGGYETTLELGTRGETDIELSDGIDELAFVSLQNTPVRLERVTIANRDVATNGFIDTGSGPRLFDCRGSGVNRTFSNAAWRVHIQ